jgi:hypothetical protein
MSAPLGGGAADAVNFIRESVRGPSVESRPSQGGRGAAPTDVVGLDAANLGRGKFFNFKLLPEILKQGYLYPGGLFAGQTYRTVVSQRLLGWSLNNATDNNGQTWDGVPMDGFSGKLPVALNPVDGLPIVTIPAANAH